jgi:hypothetical protein
MNVRDAKTSAVQINEEIENFRQNRWIPIRIGIYDETNIVTLRCGN